MFIVGKEIGCNVPLSCVHTFLKLHHAMSDLNVIIWLPRSYFHVCIILQYTGAVSLLWLAVPCGHVILILANKLMLASADPLP